MTDAERLRRISEIIARWVNEPYAEVGVGMAGSQERQYLDEILDVLAAGQEETKAEGTQS
jgi:hypothetical protein